MLIIILCAVVFVLALASAGAFAQKHHDLHSFNHLPDLTKLHHISEVPEELGMQAVETVEDLPGFGNSDEAEDAPPENFNMNANDGAAIDDELSGSMSALQVEQENVTVTLLPPARVGGNLGKGVIGRTCMNDCGGLCRGLCAKFKALKVCNGCVRGCLNKCGTGVTIPNEPFFDPYKVPKPGSVPPLGKNATKNATKM